MIAATALAALLCAAAPAERKWGFGIQLEPINSPTGHFGVPTAAVAPRIGFAFALRYQAADRWALTFGLGAPHPAMGLSIWAGHELSLSLYARDAVALSLYEDAGAQFGAVGPDYYARHGGTFVGRQYTFGGPTTFALRLPAGVRASWLSGRFDTFLEGVGILAFTPTVEPLFTFDLGFRWQF
jgi:hypothetical protein